MASLYYGSLSCWQSHQKPCRLFNWHMCLRTLSFPLFGCNLVTCGDYSACVWLCNSKPGDFLHLRDKGSTQFPLRENVHNLWNISTRATTELKKWPVSDRHWRAHLPSRVIQQGGSKFLLPEDGPGSPGGLTVKNLSVICGRLGFCPWVRKIPWRRKWQPFSGLENSMDREAWQVTVYGGRSPKVRHDLVTKQQNKESPLQQQHLGDLWDAESQAWPLQPILRWLHMMSMHVHL